MLQVAAQRGVEAGQRQTVPLPLPAFLLVAGLSTLVAAQGGYYAPLHLVVAALLAAAVLIALFRPRRPPVTGRLLPVLAAAAALAAWALARGAIGGGREGMGAAALLGGMVAVLLVCALLHPRERESLASAAIGLGLVVAVSGIVGVAWRLQPWALQDQQLWRAASTLTYANATGGILAPLALLCGALLVERPGATPRVVAACLILAGIGASLSRGAVLAFAAGAVVLAALLGVWPTVRALWPPALGGAVALAGLVPSMPAARPSSPMLAMVCLAAGAGVAVLATRLVGSRRVALLAGVSLCIVLASGLALGMRGLEIPAGPRLTLASPDRVDELQAALRLVAQRPLVGVGPGRATLVLTDGDGPVRIARYVHNEYVQVLAEFGAVGAVLLVALLGTAAWLLLRSRDAARPPFLWAGVVAALAAFALHSGLDFLWHLPALPFMAALLLGLMIPPREERTCTTDHGPALREQSPSAWSSASLSPSSRL